MLRRSQSVWREERGAAGVEFVLVLPACVFLIIGAINLAILMFTVSNLNSSADEAARWASMQIAGGATPTQATVSAYAASRYRGPGATQTFTYTAPAAGSCGNQVVATASFKLITGIYNPVVPITTKSCFP